MPTGIVAGMDSMGRILVVLGFVAGALTGAMALAAPFVAAGADLRGLTAQLVLAAGGAVGGVVGARFNRASARTLDLERAADRA
ncbi:MAG TPA: hypothetical protein VH834_06310 [Solirubrobacteraceae bacterium]